MVTQQPVLDHLDRIKLELVERRASDECGCPEEEWIINGATLIVHMDLDGNAAAFLDWGDNDDSCDIVDVKDIGAAFGRAVAWAVPYVTGAER